jgi:histidine ammonia-lyase
VSRKALDAILKRESTVYGVNTGFGMLADKRVSKEQAVGPL